MCRIMIYNAVSYLLCWATLAGIVRGFTKRQLTRLKLRRRGSYATSTFVSLIIRPILEQARIKSLVGAPLVAAVMVGSIPAITREPLLTSWDVSEPVTDILTVEMELPSEEVPITYHLPVENLTGISQTFRAGHPGLDLRAPLGSAVLAMDGGRVSEIAISKFGYGRHVYMAHGNQTYSLYAHLGKITVEPGEWLEAGAVIGEIGMSGWTTGPHLHFEVMAEGAKVNPLVYLSKALVAYQERALDLALAQ